MTLHESAHIQNFIATYKPQLLDDTLRDLNSCPINELPKLLHRLKGTLGTYDFGELSRDIGQIEKRISFTHDVKDLNQAHKEAMNAVLNEIRKGEEK